MQETKQEKSPIKQRILLFLKEKGISMYDCYAKTGITRGVLAQNNGISEDNITRFLAYYMDVSTDWLILGRGSMLRSNQEQLVSQPIVPAVVQRDSSGEAAAYYKMYEKKDAEVGVLKEEIGALKLKISQLESSPAKAPEHPPLAFDGGFVDSFTSESSGGSIKDSAHTRNPTTSLKKSSVGKM